MLQVISLGGITPPADFYESAIVHKSAFIFYVALLKIFDRVGLGVNPSPAITPQGRILGKL